MTKKKEISTKAVPLKKNDFKKVDIKLQGGTSLDPVIGKFPDEYPKGNDEFVMTLNIESVLKESISKSDKMRKLFRIGITSNKEIAYWTSSHPSFVATVIIKLKRQIKKEAGN